MSVPHTQWWLKLLRKPAPPVILLFQGQNYYPAGGAGDFVAQCDSVERAQAIAAVMPLREKYSAAYDVWWQIAELRDGKLTALLNGRVYNEDELERVEPVFDIVWRVPEE